MSNSQENFVSNEAFHALIADLNIAQATRPSVALTEGKTQKSLETVRKIIDAARDIFIREGHAGLSLRHVASVAGIAVGNLTYHFPSKRSLVDAVLFETVSEFIDSYIVQLNDAPDAPIDLLLNIINCYTDSSHQMRNFVYQMWGYAGSDATARATVLEVFRPIREFFYFLVKRANPDLTEVQAQSAVIQIFSLEEGYKLFNGLGPDDDPSLTAAKQDIRALITKIVMGS